MKGLCGPEESSHEMHQWSCVKNQSWTTNRFLADVCSLSLTETTQTLELCWCALAFQLCGLFAICKDIWGTVLKKKKNLYSSGYTTAMNVNICQIEYHNIIALHV